MALQVTLPWRLTKEFHLRSLAILIFGAVLAFLTIGPLVMIFYGSFLNGFPGQATSWTLDGYRTAFSSTGVYTALFNSVWLSAVRTILKVGLAVFFAWVIVRTDIPHKGIMEYLIMLNFFLPALTLLIGWVALARPSSGFLNVALAALPFVGKGFLDIYSYWGILWVSVMTEFPLVYILIAPAFKKMDASLEEASLVSGATRVTTVLRVTLPVLLPTVLGVAFLIFLRGMESFEIELFLGLPARIFVFSTRVYYFLRMAEPPAFGPALAFCAVFLVLALALIYVYWKCLGNRQYTTITGRGFSVRPMSLGRWRHLYAYCGLAMLLLTTMLPISMLLLASVMDIPGYFRGNWFTFKHYVAVFQSPTILGALGNSLVLGLAVATGLMALTTLTSYLVLRTRMRGRHVLDVFTWLPWSMPAMVLGVGLLLFWVGFAAPVLYGTLGLLFIALIVKQLPVGARTMSGVMSQYGAELEESSRVHGAGWVHTFRHVVFPLIRSGFMAGWVVVFAMALRELTVVSMLYGPESRTLTTVLLEFQTSGGKMPQAVIVSLLLAAIVIIPVTLQRLIQGADSRDVVHGI